MLHRPTTSGTRDKPSAICATTGRQPVADVLSSLRTIARGLTESEAQRRLKSYGKNDFGKEKRVTVVAQLLRKFANPLVGVLLIIAVSSWLFGDRVSAGVVAAMAVVSVFISFIQEYRAKKDADELAKMVHTTTAVIRDGAEREIPLSHVVPGDIVSLIAGDMIPADVRILSCKDLFVNQAAFTGESFPVEKFAEPVPTVAGSAQDCATIAFMGSSVVSGTARGVAVATGTRTQFGAIARKLTTVETRSGFDEGITKLTWLMIRAMVVLVAVIFLTNALGKGSWMESLLFALAVAVGLTPEMLPMVMVLNLSKGAIDMSRKKVIVKKLSAMQNVGSMDVLCTDKTGTLTLDKVILEKHCDLAGAEDEEVLRQAYLNSHFQTGLKGLLDRTILQHKISTSATSLPPQGEKPSEGDDVREGDKILQARSDEKLDLHGYEKIDEVPFDFERKIMSVIIAIHGKHRLIAKGAPEEIFRRCSHFELHGKISPMGERNFGPLKAEYDRLSADGFRVLAVAYRDEETSKRTFSKDDERDLILRGYLAFLDPPKQTAKDTIQALKNLGITVKVLTGDSELVTRKICTEIGIDVTGLTTGNILATLTEEELRTTVQRTTVFARLSPLQKEQIIHTLHADRHVVGYLGDGINDALALKAADVGISVNNAVDIAKESADLILLRKSLTVLKDGVTEGRRTFANILKYIRMGTSSNFGNMVSMTLASILLPFIPMLPVQVLVNNFLYDLSQLAIVTDAVDPEDVERPHTWNMREIWRFMITVGLVSSIFDLVTFGVLRWFFHATPVVFHTGWFLESLATQTLIIHCIRTEKIPFLQSSASPLLLLSSVFLTLFGFLLPFTPLAAALGFTPPPVSFLLTLVAILTLYACSVQGVKRWAATSELPIYPPERTGSVRAGIGG